jgi:hypothetical protein
LIDGPLDTVFITKKKTAVKLSYNIKQYVERMTVKIVCDIEIVCLIGNLIVLGQKVLYSWDI